MVLPALRAVSFPRPIGTVQRLPPPASPDPPGNAFFVSKTNGNDANPGTKAQPWQTLTKASSRVYAPNDTIALQANNVWTGEALLPLGNGTWAASTYASVYASTLASAQAAYLASSVFTTAVALLTAAGNATPSATATEYCRRLAVRDAVRAAFDAANAASTWVTITRYDEGAKPMIAPGGVINAGVLFDAATFAGGWKLLNVDISNCQVAGIYCQPTTTPGAGLWVEGCKVSNITGMPLPPGGADNNPRVAGFFNAWATPLGVQFVNNILARNCDFGSTSDMCVYLREALDFLVEKNFIGKTKYQPSTFIGDQSLPATTITRLVFADNFVEKQQFLGWPNGTAGLFFAGVLDTIVDNNTVQLTQTSGDGVACDLEAFCDKTLVSRNRFLNNQGTALLFEQSANITNTFIVDNRFTNNGIQDVTVNVAFARNDSGPGTVCMQNQTIRAGAGTTQKLFSGISHSFPPNVATDTPPAGWTYGTDNTVSPP